MSAFLDPEDVIRMTGYEMASYQLKWCRAHGIPAWMNAKGEVNIPLAAVEGRKIPANESAWSLDPTKIAGRG